MEFFFCSPEILQFSSVLDVLPLNSTCPVVYESVIQTSVLGFYTSTMFSSSKSCVFFFSVKLFVLNYATKEKVLSGASSEIYLERYLDYVKIK